MDLVIDLLRESAINVVQALTYMLIPAVVFLGLGWHFKGRDFLPDLRSALPETGLTLKILVFNALFAGPVLAVVITALHSWLVANDLVLFRPESWASLPTVLVLFLAVFLADFFSYWRHRLDHSALLWPAHAVHHSDTHVTWITTNRWHPINLLTVHGLFGSAILMMGFPAYAVIFNGMLRGYYGYFIHADLPFTFGRWGKYIVSPAMHRWHHSAEEKAFDKNFAEIFCLFDRMFGTFYLPGPCDGPLGVADDMQPTLKSQMSYPLRPSAYARLVRRAPTSEETAA